MSIIDTHCHIDLPTFDADRDAVIRAAVDAGVHAMVAVGFNPERWQTTAALCEAHPMIVRSVGLHPNDADTWADQTAGAIERECAADSVVAIGETGLDFYRDRAGRGAQITAFRSQLELARSLQLPVIIHQRDAEQEVLAVLRDYAPLDGVMHSFTGDASFAVECLELGLMVGIGGIATFPRSTEVRDAIGCIPVDRVVVETDAPFLAPQSRRGRRNEPALVTEVVTTLADVWQAPVDEVAAQTTSNAERLFGDRLKHALEAGRSIA